MEIQPIKIDGQWRLRVKNLEMAVKIAGYLQGRYILAKPVGNEIILEDFFGDDIKEEIERIIGEIQKI